MTPDVWTTFADGLRMGALCVLAPSVLLAFAGFILHRTVDARRPALAFEAGLTLPAAAGWAVAVGAGINALELLPLPVEIQVICTAVLFATAAASITWRARRAFAGAAITTAAMTLGAGLMEIVLACHHSATYGQLSRQAVASSMLSDWLLLGLPGGVAALIAAALSVKSLSGSGVTIFSPRVDAPAGTGGSYRSPSRRRQRAGA